MTGRRRLDWRAGPLSIYRTRSGRTIVIELGRYGGTIWIDRKGNR